MNNSNNSIIEKIEIILDIELKKIILTLINLGLSIKDICILLDISNSLFESLLKNPNLKIRFSPNINKLLDQSYKDAVFEINLSLDKSKGLIHYSAENILNKIEEVKFIQRNFFNRYLDNLKKEKVELAIKNKIESEIKKKKIESEKNKLLNFKNIIGIKILNVALISDDTYIYFTDFFNEITSDFENYLLDRGYSCYLEDYEDIRNHPDAEKYEYLSDPKSELEKIDIEVSRGGTKYFKDINDIFDELEIALKNYHNKFSELSNINFPYIDYLFQISYIIEKRKKYEIELVNLGFYINIARNLTNCVCKYNVENSYLLNCLKIIERLRKCLTYFDDDQTHVPVYVISWNDSYLSDTYDDIFCANFMEWVSSSNGKNFYHKIMKLIEESMYLGHKQFEIKLTKEWKSLGKIVYTLNGESFPFKSSYLIEFFSQLGYKVESTNKLNKDEDNKVIIIRW